MSENKDAPCVIPAGTMMAYLPEHMTLRDHYAGEAMEGLLGSDHLIAARKRAVQDRCADPNTTAREALAKLAYMMADAMLAEREKRNEPAETE